MREETEFKPKPMVRVGDKPIIWHIMKIYSHYGFNDFIFTLGYKGHMLRDYFKDNKDFNIKFAETGLKALTGERISLVKKFITDDEFMVTYGDGVADIDINELVKFHRKQGTIGTISGVHPQSKYGLIAMDKKTNLVAAFNQKPLMHDYVSGGFMIFKRVAFKYFNDRDMEDGLIKMAADGQLSVYGHEGFWKAMDTYREMEEMNELWRTKKQWAVWLTKNNK